MNPTHRLDHTRREVIETTALTALVSGGVYPGEGFDAFSKDADIRQWHAAAKKALGISKSSALTKAALMKSP